MALPVAPYVYSTKIETHTHTYPLERELETEKGKEGMDRVHAQESSVWVFIHLLYWWEMKRLCACVCIYN